LIHQRGEEGVLDTKGGDGRGVATRLLGTGAIERDGAMLGHPILNGERSAASVHVQKIRGVLVAVCSVYTRQDNAAFAGVILLEKFLKAESSFPTILKDSTAAGVRLGGILRRLFKPAILVAGGKVEVTEDDG
jgi:hypothetical protein